MIYVFLFLIMLVIDQYTKYIIDTNFLLGESSVVIDGFFNLTYVQNRGMAFGLFQGKIDIVSIIALFAVLIILGFFIKNFKKMSILERIAYTMIFSGAIGNMIDRFLRGYVIDMLDFRGIWSFIFNFADVWINIGVILIIVEYIFFGRKKEK
ncbi:signal peptidase II [Fusobacterium russii]|uniref:signal peptidase II n=1 Tax=Fusobacterium russii TaxID=854 RepID=UPI0003AAABD8|nr:signal peptidase II [Fusobacterium russii]